ncbi:MAG: hypothetical protein Q9217_000375 [Psora testacea]
MDSLDPECAYPLIISEDLIAQPELTSSTTSMSMNTPDNPLTSLAIALGLRQKPRLFQTYPTEIHITDGLSILLPLMNQNILINMPNDPPAEVSLHADLLPWGQPTPSSVPPHPDVILAADCAYLEQSFPLLVETLKDLMGEETVLWFCYKKRRKRDRDCIRLIGKVFDVQAVKGAWEMEGVWLFRGRKRIRELKKSGDKEGDGKT